MAFKPRKGERSEAVIVTDLMAAQPYGTLITYEDIAAKLGFDPPVDRSRVQGVVNTAKIRLLRNHKRALAAVWGTGYRVILPSEHAAQALAHQGKADRQLRRAILTIQATDETALTPSELNRNRQVSTALSLLYANQQAMDERVTRLEKLLYGKEPPSIIPGHVMVEDE